MEKNNTRYTNIAIALHWVIAISIIIMLISGLAMTEFDLEKSLTFKLYQWHKSGGVLLIFAITLRIIWRITHRPPSLPENMPALEQKAAHAGHVLLYIAMIIMPLSGWVIVSTSTYGLPTIVFGWFTWPHIPGVAGDEGLHEISEAVHYWCAIIFALLIALHIAATIKHHLADHTPIIHRMLPGRQQ